MGLYKKVCIEKIVDETADTKTMFLRVEGPGSIVYEAGQFLTFVFTKPAGEERRSYSISSAPALQEPLSITIKRLENGEYSRQLFDKAKVGDCLTTTGAAGFFVLPANPDQYRQFFFMAAGSGITPILPLIKTLLYLHEQTSVVLIYSNRKKESTIFYEELLALQAMFAGRFIIEFLFSTALQLEKARLGKWLFAALLEKLGIGSLSGSLFYTCGPFDYMRMVTITLLENKVPLQHIRKENFAPLKIEHKTLPPDVHQHGITIHIQHKTHRISTQYPQTILAAAKKAGIQLPYSCESGRCGSCAATCVVGKVWMSYNEVLLDEEIKSGRVLTCVGYPVDGDIVLNF